MRERMAILSRFQFECDASQCEASLPFCKASGRAKLISPWSNMVRHGCRDLFRCVLRHHQLSSFIVRTTLTKLELLDDYGSVAAFSSLMRRL